MLTDYTGLVSVILDHLFFEKWCEDRYVGGQSKLSRLVNMEVAQRTGYAGPL